MEADGIVNAANNSLLGGGGVDGAIHRVGGRSILDACMEIRANRGGCKTGNAVITTAGDLPAKKVIHTVGPVWQGGGHGEDDLLRSCYLESRKIAEENNLLSIAFPNISTGIYGFPKSRAAKIAIDTVISYKSQTIQEVIFVCFDEENYEIYQSLQK